MSVSCVSTSLSLTFLALVARKIPFDDPIILNYVRAGYVFSQLLALGTYLYLSHVVRSVPPSYLDMMTDYVFSWLADQAKE